MFISLHDDANVVSLNYVQTLVLLFLPCETFADTESSARRAYVSIAFNRNICAVDAALYVDGSSERASDSMMLAGGDVMLDAKNLVGRTFIKAAEKLFGFVSPWGILTGIRPAKLAASYLDTLTPFETEQKLMHDYLLTAEKAKMCVRVAAYEKKLVKQMPPRSCSLYVSIPFCPSRCRYCSFVSSTTPRLLSLIPDYLVKLKTDLKAISETVRDLDLKLETVYFGGGTPAVLNEPQMDDLLTCMTTLFDVGNLSEYTFEAGRPDCITAEKLRIIAKSGVSRISINTQTANDEVLRAVGRKHTFAEYLNCMDMARAAGNMAINTDLIAGLPGETEESFYDSVRKVMAANPENITVHSFTLKRSSEFKTGKLAEVSSASVAASNMVSFAAQTLMGSDYAPYYLYRQKNTVGNLDNTGYAKAGYEGLYNIYMMGEYHSVFAAGAGAVTKLVSADRSRIERVFLPKYPYEYLDESLHYGFDRGAVETFYRESY